MSNFITQVLKPVKKVHGGQRIDHRKNTAECSSVTMPPPSKVTIPLSMHIGAPCTPKVAKGDRVLVGQCIADSDSPVSAPIHASVSGTLSAIGTANLANGRTVQSVTIDSDGLMEPDPSIAPPTVDSVDSFIDAVRASGLVGLGGAGFPAAIKLRPSGKNVDTLIINAAECEPYITTDYRECIESHDSILNGISIILKWLHLKQAVICIEENKPRAIELLADIASKDDCCGDKVKLMRLPSSYPQGAEKVIVYSATGRVVPSGGLPADVGCIVMNITSVSFLGKYFETGMPLVSKRLTVDGSAISEPKNVVVPIGTSVGDVIDFCGGFKCEPKKLIIGGPMMGSAIFDTDVPIVKASNSIIALDEKDATPPQPSACIRCGRCVSACPMNLMPMQVEQAIAADNIDRLNKLSVLSCMECGCCSYGCPAKRPLVQSMRIAKQMIKEMK